MVNIWNAYQCMVTFNLSRSTSFYESGIGRGMGFRDSNQDLLGFVQMVPERARQRILDIAATQLSTGGAYHQYQPLTKRGNDDIGSGFNDDPLWLVLGVAAYLSETGRRAILDEPVQYDNAEGSEAPLLDHLQRASRYTLDRLGPHGLPLIGRADWNDCLNLNCFSTPPARPSRPPGTGVAGVAESVFIAGQFVLAARELAGIVRPGRAGRRGGLAAESPGQAGWPPTIAEHGWDGEPGSCGPTTTSATRLVGSCRNEEGQIFVESQGMCVMAGVGASRTGRRARPSTACGSGSPPSTGSCCSSPPTRDYHPELGEISSYPPGYKENAGIFCHTNPWIMIAEAMTGDGDAAFDYLPPDQSLGARGDQRGPSLRALRLCADDRRP